jgi:hypothetical protein
MIEYKFFTRTNLNEQKRVIEIIQGSFNNNGSEIIDDIIETGDPDWFNLSNEQWQNMIPQIKAQISAIEKQAESRGGVIVDDDATLQ